MLYFITSSPLNVLAVLALHLSLLLLSHLHHFLSDTDRSFRLCFTMSLESTPFIFSSTSFWYQFLHFRLIYSFFFWFTTLLIHNSLSPRKWGGKSHLTRGRGATGSRGSVDPPLFQVRGPHMGVDPHFCEDQLELSSHLTLFLMNRRIMNINCR